MNAYLVHNVYRFRKDLIIEGHFLMNMKIGNKLKYKEYEFVVKGIVLGNHSNFKKDAQSIVLEPVVKIENEQILINQMLEIDD